MDIKQFFSYLFGDGATHDLALQLLDAYARCSRPVFQGADVHATAGSR